MFRGVWLWVFFWSFNCFSNTYVFVSHSMGDEALKSYDQEAQKHGATLVMRGLLEDSFQKTKSKAEALKITYDINPPLFEDYGVTRVPVIVSGDHKMTGHVKLGYALEKFKTKTHEGGA